jgi:cephalosporin-C deacetylase-like acetyl esterase
MNKKALTLLALSILGLASTALAEPVLTGETDKPPVSYTPGENMIFSVSLEEDGQPVEGVRLVWERAGDDGQTQNGEALSGQKPLRITTSLDEPGFVFIKVTAVDETGKTLLRENKKTLEFKGGAGVMPEQLQALPEPGQFGAYWERQKALLASEPMEILEMVPMPSENPNVDTWDVKISCPGGMPVSGYLSKPRGAAAKSSTAKVYFMGYGVRSAQRKDGLAGYPAYPALIFTINAHGIENGRKSEYYTNLHATDLKGYAFDKAENEDPETAYFHGMALRVLRALEFVKSQPEWNGETLLVSGGSQGGLQALWAAGLDPDVSACNVSKPWCCDLGGVTLGRTRGWRPDYTPALGYYDPVYHARRIRCPVEITSGLGDDVCPPSGLSVLYNNIQSPRRIEYVQGMTHSYMPAKPQTQTLSGN